MDIVLGQTVFQDTHFVIGEYAQGPYRALRKLDTQVAEISRGAPTPDSPLYAETQARLANYAALREEIIASRPSEYWDAGFEAAEAEYWVNILSRKVALETTLNARPSLDTMNAVLSLPKDLQTAVMAKAKTETLSLKTLSSPLLRLACE